MKPARISLVVIAFSIATLCLKAQPGPAPSTRALSDLADLIIVGNVESVKQTGTGSIELDGRIYERLDFRAEVHVDETIKGEPAPLHFVFTYSAPGMDYAGKGAAGGLAGGGLLVGSYEIIFLKKTATGYAFVSPFFPSFPATSKSCGPNWQLDLGEDAYHRVLQRELSVLCAASR